MKQHLNLEDSIKDILTRLAKREIKKIKLLPQPVVRVCGPLTCDGPAGYERNAARLVEAEKVLQQKSLTVWTCSESEKEIFSQGYSNEDIMTYFHKPILESGLITSAYFLPRWNESPGASLERDISRELKIEIMDFPEEWFQPYQLAS